jgi:transcriptional regulator with XRE-family HTH domain
MLSHECPRCFSEQRAIPQLPVPWLCQHCGYDLYARRLSSTERKRRTPTNRQLWYARSVEKLIERSCANGERIQEGCVSAAIDRLVNQHALSSVSILGEKLNINTRYLKSWHSGISRPTLQSLADLCYRIDVPIDKFLLDSDVLTSPDMWRHLSKPHFIESTRLGDRMRKEIKATLRRFISNPPKVPPSVTDIAAQFDLSHTTLRSHFPEEYEILKKRASLWRQKCSDENQRVRLRNLCIAVKALADAGVYPGERQLRKSELLIASDFRRPDFLLKLRELQHRYRHLYDKDICR